jgi:Mrp family chromosome partitioning ATPase
MVDLPPLAPTADVRAAAQGLNGILLIVEWGRTGERQLREALRALGPARAKLLGVIINRTPEHAFKTIAVAGSPRGAPSRLRQPTPQHHLSDQVSPSRNNKEVLWPPTS